uniref:AMP-binding protein n=1 Tax=Paenibacillus polymyxa TaxID=1406 RepID=A0AAE9THV4_PAEPO
MKSYFVHNSCDAWNMFGPTETTIWSTIQKIDADKPVSIGKPIANTQIYILDKHLRPVPVGLPGELLFRAADWPEAIGTSQRLRLKSS